MCVILEAELVGDKYKYTIKAETQQEALIKLVKYFYGEECDQDVESEHFNVFYPNHSTFKTNMPYWFAELISGNVKHDGKDLRKTLKMFAIKHDIKLKNDI